jgi:hypothetical protein
MSRAGDSHLCQPDDTTGPLRKSGKHQEPTHHQFRRASSQHILCLDAKAFNSEARRRVVRFRASAGSVSDGDRILILCEDQDGKTDDLGAILIKAGTTFSKINGQFDATMTARLLAPQPRSEDQDEEELRSKNHSSTILNIAITGDGVPDAAHHLCPSVSRRAQTHLIGTPLIVTRARDATEGDIQNLNRAR